MKNDISNSEDTLDVRDIIARVEELRDEREAFEESEPSGVQWASVELDEAEELATLEELLSDLCGRGGDEQWEGDWYPVTLVRDSYFQDYAQELAEDCGFASGNKWPARCVDWEQAARELQMDYSAVEFDGVTYWYR